MNAEYFEERFTTENLPPTFRSGLFENCSFESCDLKHFDFTSARFSDCTFRSCDLSNAKLSNSRFQECSFRDCKLLGIQWIVLESAANLTFQNSNLSYSNFIGLKLRKTSFVGCQLQDVDFSQADLTEADFGQANLQNSRFHETTLLRANFQGAVAYEIDPRSNKVKGARFSLPDALGLLTGLGVIITD